MENAISRTILRKNVHVMSEIGRIAEVADYLWMRGWAERNGGNISVDVTSFLSDGEKTLPALSETCLLPEAVPLLGGHFLYVTGTGKRMREVAKAPLANGTIIRIASGGCSFEIVAESLIKPTSELPSHLLIHHKQRELGRAARVVLHTHPTELIGMTHCKPFTDSETLTRTLWGMIPECRMFVPKGIGMVPYQTPGSIELARATLVELKQHEVVCWEKHGVLAVGEDIVECFDTIDTLNKAVQIYLSARMAGYEPEGISERQLNDLAESLGL